MFILTTKHDAATSRKNADRRRFLASTIILTNEAILGFSTPGPLDPFGAMGIRPTAAHYRGTDTHRQQLHPQSGPSAAESSGNLIHRSNNPPSILLNFNNLEKQAPKNTAAN